MAPALSSGPAKWKRRVMSALPKISLAAVALVLSLGATAAFAAPKVEPWPRWQVSDGHSTLRADHAAWAAFLGKYLVVTPAEPLVAWVRSLGPDAPEVAERGLEFTIQEAQAYNRTAYLVPVGEDAHDVEAWVEENFDLIFEQELHAFTPNRRRWPRKRTVDVFLEWFDLELLDSPIDLVDAPLVASTPRRS